MREVGDDGDENGDDGRVVDEPGDGAGDADGGQKLSVAVFAGEGGHLPAEDLDEARPTDTRTQDEHREDGERRGVGKARHALGSRDAGEVHDTVAPEHHQDDHDENRRHVDRQELRHEQAEREQHDAEDDEGVGRHRGGRQGRGGHDIDRGTNSGHVFDGRKRSRAFKIPTFER